MSGLQEIEVVILPDGQVHVRVNGVKGESCVDLTRELERYLGGRVVDRQHTSEYREQAQRQDESVTMGRPTR
jgi:hypothetical protein